MFICQLNQHCSIFQAQEDAEVLRSLVIPLEEEIKALKDKLRETDKKLRKYEENVVSKDFIL